MKYAVEMDSDTMIYIPSFIQIGSGIQKLIRTGRAIRRHRHYGDPTSLLSFLQNTESWLKIQSPPKIISCRRQIKTKSV
jgi:hypothetical protein